MNDKFFALVLILIFSSAFVYSQNEEVTVNVKKEVKKEDSFSDIIKASAARLGADAKRVEAMSEPSTEVKVPIEVDLYNYTHIAIIDATFASTYSKYADSSSYRKTAETLGNSPLSIINPREYDKKKFKKNKRFLRDIKNPDWIYLYYTESIVGFDEIKSLVLRDYKNKIIYNVSTINVSQDEIVSPIVNF